jgi:HEAT repeat protein
MATRQGLKESRLRAPSIKALGDIGDPRAISVIEKALEDHSEQVRQAAKRALEQLQRPQR